LKRFKEITNEIISEKSATNPKVVVFSKVLLIYCIQLKQNNTNSNNLTVTTAFINVLTKQIEDRFDKLEKNMLYAEAVILDPRFKKHGFFNINSFTEDKNTLLNKATNINLDTEHLYNTLIVIPPTTSSDSIWNDFDSKVQNLVQITKSKSAAIIISFCKTLFGATP